MLSSSMLDRRPTSCHSGGGEGGGLMKPLAAVATSFVAMKVIFSHSRKKKGIKSLEEVSQSANQPTRSAAGFVDGAPVGARLSAQDVFNVLAVH